MQTLPFVSLPCKLELFLYYSLSYLLILSRGQQIKCLVKKTVIKVLMSKSAYTFKTRVKIGIRCLRGVLSTIFNILASEITFSASATTARIVYVLHWRGLELQ